MSSYTNIVKKEPKHEVEAETIIQFVTNKKTNTIQANDVVEVRGIIKEINFLNNRTTIYLGSNSHDSTFIICDMQNSEKSQVALLNKFQAIKLKGIFKGFLSDIVLLDCVISQ